jgi:hypothetical protein
MQELDVKGADILRFIRLAILRPEQIDQILPHFTSGGDDRELRARLVSDEDVRQFIPTISELFSHEEILRLIAFYEAPVIAKYFRLGAQVSSPVYASIPSLTMS